MKDEEKKQPIIKTSDVASRSVKQEEEEKPKKVKIITTGDLFSKEKGKGKSKFPGFYTTKVVPDLLPFQREEEEEEEEKSSMITTKEIKGGKR